MGGTALAKYGFTSRRIDSKEYECIVNEISQLFVNYVRDTCRVVGSLQPVQSYRTKESHGDIDFIMVSASSRLSEFGWIPHTYLHLPKNSNTYSLDYKGIQIDIVSCKTYDEYAGYLNYYNWSPFGNIYGKVLKQFGLKWGIDGLTYPVKLSDSEQLGEISITTYIDMILEFGGLSEDEYHRGFETQEDIFKYVYSSQYFNSDIFKFENLNHISRTRDRKRKDYHAWVEWIADKPNKFVGAEDKSVYLPKICEFFNIDLYELINAKLSNHRWIQHLRTKFSGRHVMELFPDLSGKFLGDFLKFFKQQVSTSDSNFNFWIDMTPQPQINQKIIELYGVYTRRSIESGT